MKLHPERYALALLSLLFSLAARGEAVVVVEHWPPWEIVDADTGAITGGRAVELTRTLFGRLNVDVTFRNVPWQRALKQIRTGEADIIPMISRTPVRTDGMAFSDPVYRDQLLLVTASDHPEHSECRWNRPGALENKTVGVTRDYVYGNNWSALRQERQVRVVRSNNDLAHLKKAMSARVDYSLQYYSFLQSSLTDPELDRDELLFCQPPVEEIALRFGIARQSPLAERMPEINQALETMKQDGSCRAILGELYREP